MGARLGLAQAERGILARDRGILARAITLVESVRPRDREAADELIGRLYARTGKGLRVGISGPPGVGKSTLIDALGAHVVEQGMTIAVLAIDPSSTVTGGSILGDKTRMPRIATDPRAFVRPSPSGEHLGGVARTTRQVLLLCEAFGFDCVIVETIGVGQSETEVAGMVDTFVLLAQGGAGDELQGIKRGIMEAADIVAVNKADGEGLAPARRAARDLGAAMRLMRRRASSWEPRPSLVSGLTGSGVPELFAAMKQHRATLEAAGDLATLRRAQSVRWFRTDLERLFVDEARSRAGVASLLTERERAVGEGVLAPSVAAREVFDAARAGGSQP